MNEEYMCDFIQFIGDEKCIALLCIDCWKELSPLKEELASYHKYLSTPHGLTTL